MENVGKFFGHVCIFAAAGLATLLILSLVGEVRGIDGGKVFLVGLMVGKAGEWLINL